MSKVVAQMRKMKLGNLGGIQRHNQREFKNHSNKEIDKSLSHLNYDLVNEHQINYQNKIMESINERKVSQRAVRKDAVLVNEWIISSDTKFFSDLTEKECRRYFEEATNFFKKRYGVENIPYAQVHLDETTPHMHLGIIPMRDGRLQAKNVFNRNELLSIQSELPKYLQEKGFDIKRGREGSKAKHLDTLDYKVKVRAEEVQELEQEKQVRAEEVQKLKDAAEKIPEWVTGAHIEHETEKVKDGLFKSSLKRTGRVVVDEKEFNSIKVLAEGANALKNEIRANQREMERLHKVIESKNKEIDSLKETVKEKDRKINKLRKHLTIWKDASLDFVKNGIAMMREGFGKRLGKIAHLNDFWNYELDELLPSGDDEIRKGIDLGFELSRNNEQDIVKYIKLMCQVESDPQIALENQSTFLMCGNREGNLEREGLKNMISVRLEAIERFKEDYENTWEEYTWVRNTENYWKVAQSQLYEGEDIFKFVIEEPGKLKSMIETDQKRRMESSGAHVEIIMPKKTGRSRAVDSGWELER